MLSFAVHLIVVFQILARGTFVEPVFVFLIPFDGQFDPVFEHRRRLPAEFRHRFGRIDRVPLVVPLAVGHVLNQRFRLVQFFQDDLDDLDVGFFVMAAEVVDLADSSLFQHRQNAAAMILDVQPVADVEPLSVNRELFVVGCVVDHQGDQLFRELIGTVIVAATRNGHGQLVRAVVGEHKKIGARFAGRIRARRVDRRVFVEKQVRSVERQITVDFVGADLVETLNPEFAASIHQDLRSENVGFEEDPGVLDRAVHVGFRREVHHDVGSLLFKDAVDAVPVPDVGLVEDVVRVLQFFLDGGRVGGIRQRIDVYDPPLGSFFQKQLAETVADKAGAAGDEDCFFHNSNTAFDFIHVVFLVFSTTALLV